MTSQPRWVRALPTVVVLGVLATTVPETHRLARDLLGLPHPLLAWGLVAVVDGYVITALRYGRDRRWALGGLFVIVATSVVTHTVEAAGRDIPLGVRAALAIVTVGVVVTVCWRVHELIHAHHDAERQFAARAARRAPRAAGPVDRSADIRPDSQTDSSRGDNRELAAQEATDEDILRWLTQADDARRTYAATAEHFGLPKSGRRVRRLVDTWRAEAGRPHAAAG